jgi:hypothetical protein
MFNDLGSESLSVPFEFRHCEVLRKASAMEPTYYMLMFSKNGRHYAEYFRVYIELQDEDKALLGGVLSDAMKARLMVARVGILSLLPSGINDDWHDFGSVIERDIKDFWHMGIKPTSVSGRNIWIIQGV